MLAMKLSFARQISWPFFPQQCCLRHYDIKHTIFGGDLIEMRLGFSLLSGKREKLNKKLYTKLFRHLVSVIFFII